MRTFSPHDTSYSTSTQEAARSDLTTTTLGAPPTSPGGAVRRMQDASDLFAMACGGAASGPTAPAPRAAAAPRGPPGGGSGIAGAGNPPAFEEAVRRLEAELDAVAWTLRRPGLGAPAMSNGRYPRGAVGGGVILEEEEEEYATEGNPSAFEEAVRRLEAELDAVAWSLKQEEEAKPRRRRPATGPGTRPPPWSRSWTSSTTAELGSLRGSLERAEPEPESFEEAVRRLETASDAFCILASDAEQRSNASKSCRSGCLSWFSCCDAERGMEEEEEEAQALRLPQTVQEAEDAKLW